MSSHGNDSVQGGRNDARDGGGDGDDAMTNILRMLANLQRSNERLDITLDVINARLDNLERQRDKPHVTYNEIPNPTPRFDPLEDQLRRLEDQLLAMKSNDIHTENQRGYQPVGDNLPQGFSLKGMPKFDGTQDPLQHIRAFKDFLAIQNVPNNMFLMLFHTSLEDRPRQWYYKLDPKKTSTWEDVSIEFAKQYADNAEVQDNLRTLEILTQGEKEGFTDFLNRWRMVSTKLVDRPDEATLVEKFVDNLTPIYSTRLRYLNIDTFKALKVVGIRIEDDIAQGILTKSGYQSSGSKPYGSSNTTTIKDDQDED